MILNYGDFIFENVKNLTEDTLKYTPNFKTIINSIKSGNASRVSTLLQSFSQNPTKIFH